MNASAIAQSPQPASDRDTLTAELRAINGLPRYELRAKRPGASNLALEIWQLPAPATPQIERPVRLAGLKGRNLALIEHRVLWRLAAADVKLGRLTATVQAYALDEEAALFLGLVFRAIAPMRNRDNILACVEGIEAMAREEAAYWLGMAMYRKNPRRVLAALRLLLRD